MFAGAGALSVTLRVHIDGRDADYSLDHDGRIVPDRNSRDRPLHQLFHGERAHVCRAAKLSELASFPRRYATLSISYNYYILNLIYDETSVS